MKEMFTMKFCVDGAAYRDENGNIDYSAIARTLRHCSNGVESDMNSGFVIDLNGNNVGEWKIAEEQ